MPKTLPAVDGYIRKNKQWSAELQALRELILAAGLTETVKWRTPCYTFEDKNVMFIGAFKDHVLFSFLKGVLFKDPKKLLEQPGENTQAARVLRLRSMDQIKQLTPTLKAYIKEAIEVEKSGVKPVMKTTEEFDFPKEFTAALNDNTALKQAFESLTPGRQRGYLLYFNGAKQSKTRTARVEKVTPRILDGKGLDD